MILSKRNNLDNEKSINVPWVISKDPSNFQEMIRFLIDSEKSEGLPEGWVPGSTYWLIINYKKVVGAVNQIQIMLRKTEMLSKDSGLNYKRYVAKKRQWWMEIS